jgi:5-methylcytosine-specific restriction endonuclease McrA
MSKKLKCLTDPYTCHLCGITSNPTNKSFRSILEIHHIIEKNKGGKDTPDNLIPLCSNHHSLVHEGKIILKQWHFSTRGWLMEWIDETGNLTFGQKSINI